MNLSNFLYNNTVFLLEGTLNYGHNTQNLSIKYNSYTSPMLLSQLQVTVPSLLNTKLHYVWIPLSHTMYYYTAVLLLYISTGQEEFLSDCSGQKIELEYFMQAMIHNN